MITKNIRKYAAPLFMLVFLSKMIISVVPIFSFLDSKVAISVIMQLEQETKAEKESPDKDSFKEKKSMDEQLLTNFHYNALVLETNCLHNQEDALLVQLYHRVVPTPPPNV